MHYYVFETGGSDPLDMPTQAFATDREAIAYAIGYNRLERENNFNPGLLDNNLICRITLVQRHTNRLVRQVIGARVKYMDHLDADCSQLLRTDGEAS